VINRAQVQGDEGGEEIVMGSVVYLGRDSFRMETVVEAFDEDGAPREVTGIVTSPYRTRTAIPTNDGAQDAAQIANDLLPQIANDLLPQIANDLLPQIANDLLPQIDEDATEIIARARAGEWRADEAPSLPDALFGSQTDVPILSAPTERIFTRRRRSVSLSRGALVAAGMLLFACGLASGAVARRATSSRTATVVVQAPATTAATPAPREIAEAIPTEPAPTSTVVTPTMIELPEPILVRVHKKAAAHAAPAPARWVDPFAD
jgi:hypothetical protein